MAVAVTTALAASTRVAPGLGPSLGAGDVAPVQSTVTRRKAPDKPATPQSPSAPPTPPADPSPPNAQTPQSQAPESIEIDVSMRNVAITSTFSGTEIVIFGSVENSRQQSAESGYYDLVVIVDGATAPAVVRKKSKMFGIWVNADRMRFETLPLYRAIASNRPVDEIAERSVLASNRITLDHYMRTGDTIPRAKVFSAAASRLKQRDGLYVSRDYGAAFIGRTLFRAGVKLPANIPVGPLEVRALLFHDGKVLATRAASVRLEREGLERLIYDFAYEQPFLYGLLAVIIALGAGLVASAVFQRPQS
ncbi:MAG: TIGR02186 family protein [Hyphomicrobiaceae bacterium]|nr:TIGR02186 family protein [Hyphomicrobiaceae bacterium]